MISHILRLIWNRKKKNGLMIAEIFISFLVLFAVMSFIIYNVSNYTTPLGFEYKNVWLIQFRPKTDDFETVSNKQNQIRLMLESNQSVLSYSFALYCTPFSYSGSRTSYQLNGKRVGIDILSTDENFFDLMGMTLEEGVKLANSDSIAAIPKIMMNRRFVKDVYNNEEFLGWDKADIFDGTDVNIVGVYSDFRKEGEFSEPSYNMVRIFNPDQYDRNYSQVFVKVPEGSSAELEEQLINQVAQITKTWNLNIERLEDRRARFIDDQMMTIYVYSMISLFLILNVAFGAVWCLMVQY